VSTCPLDGEILEAHLLPTLRDDERALVQGGAADAESIPIWSPAVVVGCAQAGGGTSASRPARAGGEARGERGAEHAVTRTGRFMGKRVTQRTVRAAPRGARVGHAPPPGLRCAA